MKKAMYAGSFDPISNGHLDIITRAAKLVTELHVVVSYNQNKKSTLSLETKIELIKKVTKDIPNVVVSSYDGLTVNYAKENNINLLIRSLRNYQDYEQEFSLFQYNKDICEDVETMLLLPSSKNIFISSTAIRELIYFNCDISKYVPLEIKDDIIKGFKK
ncbi:MAG: pantetheine-phosphate adenylyltransferase [bacterium]